MNRSATASQSLGNPERKNTPCISDLAGGEISFEKGKGVFLSGFCPRSFWAGGEAKYGRGRNVRRVF